jgi:PAS domain S-box-containing protein
MLNEDVFGVIELAAFKPFEKFEVEFLQKVGESIASSISNLKVNERTKELLAQSLQQSEEMRSQEEEMRQNFEELSATQEEMHRILHEAQQKELYLNELINASNDSIFTLDNNYQLLSWNKTLEVMLQASGVKVFKGFPLLSLFPNEKQKEEQVALYNRALQGESFEITTEYTADGITSHYRNGLSPLKNDKGEIFGIVSFSKDVTEMVVAQQKAEKLTLEANQQIEELRAQEEEIRQNMEELSSTQEEMHQVLQDVQEKEAYMRNFINASSDTILAVDANLRISMFNKAFEDFAEKTFKRKVEKGVNVEVFLSKENLDKQLEVYRNVLKNGETFELIKKYGDQTLDIKYSPIRDDNNKIIGVSLFTKDVSELEKLRTLVHAN